MINVSKFSKVWVRLCSIVIASSIFIMQSIKAAENLEKTYRIAPKAHWVSETSIPNESGASQDKGVDYLLVDRQIDFRTEREDYTRITYSVKQKAALANNSQVIVDYYPDYEYLTFHHLHLIRNGQIIDVLDDDSITVASKEDSQESLMLTGKVSASIQINGLQVNDIVDYAYSLQGANPIFDGKVFFHQSTSWSEPLEMLNFKVLSPRKLQIQQTSQKEKLTVSREGENYVYKLNLKKINAKLDHDRIPERYVYFDYIQGTEFTEWAQVSDWALPYYVNDEPLNEELIGLIQQWNNLPAREGLSQKETAILAAIRFVQDDIRYFGIEIGVNSHKPHHPNEVISRRYGDCKDKTVLLVRLLKELGVSADPVLVSTSLYSGIDAFLPTPGVFNHVIARLKYKGNYYYIDGTQTAKRGNLLSVSYLPYKKGLVIAPGSTKLIELQMHDFDHSISSEEVILTPDFAEASELQVTTLYSGLEADKVRYWYKTSNLDTIKNNFLNYYGKLYKNVSPIESLVFEDNEERNQVTIKERYRVENFWDYSSRYYYKDLSTGELQQRLYYPTVVNRTAPLGLSYPSNITYSFVARLPEDIVLEDANIQTYFSDKALTLNKTVKKSKNIGSVTYQLTMLEEEVSSERVKTYMKNVDDIYQALSERFIFSMSKSAQKRKRKNRLRNLIKD